MLSGFANQNGGFVCSTENFAIRYSANNHSRVQSSEHQGPSYGLEPAPSGARLHVEGNQLCVIRGSEVSLQNYVTVYGRTISALAQLCIGEF